MDTVLTGGEMRMGTSRGRFGCVHDDMAEACEGAEDAGQRARFTEAVRDFMRGASASVTSSGQVEAIIRSARDLPDGDEPLPGDVQEGVERLRQRYGVLLPEVDGRSSRTFAQARRILHDMLF